MLSLNVTFFISFERLSFLRKLIFGQPTHVGGCDSKAWRFFLSRIFSIRLQAERLLCEYCVGVAYRQTFLKAALLTRPTFAIGIESALWSETVRTAEQMYIMLFPRLLAVAERAWHKASWEEVTDRWAREREMTDDWERFANTITYRELGRLDEMGVPYRVPPPAAR